jgi:hypothetical protein
MKREVSRDKYLPAFSMDLDDLELLLSRLLSLFSEDGRMYSSIQLQLKRETLEFKNVQEIREYNGLRPPPSGKLSPVLLTMRGLKEMTSAALQRGCQS